VIGRITSESLFTVKKRKFKAQSALPHAMQKRIANGFSLAENPGPIWRDPRETTGCARTSSLERHSKA
jgi:hypothetical protein